MKCVSYTRTLPWKNHQGELAIAEQNQRIAAYLAEHKELDLLKKYSDRKNDEKARTAFDQMTDDGVERKFDCIIVASMYYCGPDFPAARQAIKETLYATGIDLIVLDEGLDTRTASRKEVEDYFEVKRCEMHAEIMFAWRRKQGAGFRLTSSVPFGYIRRNGESNMIKDEEVAPYLSEAFSRYASGQKMRDIAKWLNEQGVEPPMRHKKRILGKSYDAESDQWTTDMLRCLFRNPTYTGAAANGSRQIIAENCHEPYITKEQFYAFPCNMREGENKISIRKSYKKPNPLAKHIVCTCGYALCWHKDKKTGEELFYCRHCRAHKENGKNLKVPAATIYKKVMDALELEHLEEEKLAAAIQQGAGRKVIEAVRAEKSVQMKSILAELNMEQFRRVPLYESYMANEITEEQYHAELMDYEEAHRKLNERLTAIMEDTLVWERALSLRNPWIQQMAQYKAPEELDRNFVKKYIEQITVTLLENGQAKISLTMKTDEWKKMLGRMVNAMYAKDISKKIWTSLQRKKEAGYAVGNDAPYGYIRNPMTKRNEIDPEAAFYVQLIFQWELMGVPIFEIARRMTLLQVPTPREWHRKMVEGKEVTFCKKWGVTTIRHILENQTYVGDTINNKSTQKLFAGQDKRDLPKEQWYVAKNTHPAIIARDDFEKVQKILDKNRAVFHTVRAKSEQIRTEYQNDLAGMVFCADCGRPMEFERLPHGAEESKKVCYYICKARQADDKCIGHQITEKLLKALIMDQLHLFITQLSDRRKVVEELRKIEDVQNPVYRAKGEIMSLTDKVSQMAKKREQLYADYVAGVVDSEDYQLIREDYSRQYDGLRAALQEAENKKVQVEQQIEEYLNMTSHLEEHLDNFEFDIQLVKSLVQKIEVSADKRIRIVFGFRDVFTELGKESAET